MPYQGGHSFWFQGDAVKPRPKDALFGCALGDATSAASTVHTWYWVVPSPFDLRVNDLGRVETLSGCFAATISDIALDESWQSWQSPRPVRF